jgi:hypothetical protein
MYIGAVGAILLGFPYIFGAFGPTEVEVQIWGVVSVGIGAFLGLLCLAIGRSNKRIAKVALALGYIFLALFQVLPIYLWFMFHGYGISDGTPPSAFVAHWGYSISHIILFVVGLAVPFVIFRDEVRPAD